MHGEQLIGIRGLELSDDQWTPGLTDWRNKQAARMNLQAGTQAVEPDASARKGVMPLLGLTL